MYPHKHKDIFCGEAEAIIVVDIWLNSLSKMHVVIYMYLRLFLRRFEINTWPIMNVKTCNFTFACNRISPLGM